MEFYFDLDLTLFKFPGQYLCPFATFWDNKSQVKHTEHLQSPQAEASQISLAYDTSLQVLPLTTGRVGLPKGCAGGVKGPSGKSQELDVTSSSANHYVACHREDYTYKYRKYSKYSSFLVSHLIDLDISCDCMEVRNKIKTRQTLAVLYPVHIIEVKHIYWRGLEQKADR